MFVVIFTHSYPYDFAAEQTFVQHEISQVMEQFDRVILIPKTTRGAKYPVAAGVEVDEQYSAFLKINSHPRRLVSRAARSKILRWELQRKRVLFLSPSRLLKLVMFAGRAELTRQWLSDWLRARAIRPADGILYSYWLDHAATGLSMLKPEFPAIKTVSRAHGYDLYEEYYFPYYWPYRRETLAALDRLFFASEAGRTYFCARYPEFSSKYETAHLGIADPGFISRSSADGVFRMVSCSSIVSVKRIDLLVQSLAVLARLRPAQTFEWIHFGDGNARKSLEKQMAREFPANIKGHFAGRVSNEQVMQHYRDQPCDVFINVSETEGGAPVAIQEAISCGIPVVAAAVGGNPEIVSERNGILLEPDPTPAQIAAALLIIKDDSERAAQKRLESRRLWEASYNADINFRDFAERLKLIRNSD